DGIPAILQLAAETTPDTNRHLRSLVSPDVIKSIQILPDVTHRELPEHYSGASVSVLSSVSETFGMTMIESLACGTPVVGTNSGAIPEVITNSCIGNLFEMDVENEAVSVLNLFRALKSTLELARDPGSIERCREHASQYDWKKVAKRMESLYERVIYGEP
ncbi:MAG: glycosyltransferase, partial [Candidatus Bathyarchaeota archaeon]